MSVSPSGRNDAAIGAVSRKSRAVAMVPAAAPVPPFRIRECILAGFGVYEQPTQFLFPDGPGIFWGTNERGKTTLVWGITSVWFGLPGSSDPTRVGTARFRSLSGPGEFYGEVAWEHAGHRYRLRRDFATHRVILREETDSMPRVIYAGEHNPQGRSSAGSEFPRALRELLGIAELPLFLETFCVSQRLPDPSAVGEELQHLISGSRTGKVTDVLARLFQQIKDLTRATGDLGLTRPGTSRPTNQRDYGLIETLEMRLQKARLELKDGRAVLETVNRSAQGFRSVQDDLTQLRQSIRDRKLRLDVVERWLEANEDRTRRAHRLSSLQSARDGLGEADSERRDLERALVEDYSDYSVAPADLAARLEDVERADREVIRAHQDASERTRRRAEREAELQSLETRLETEFHDVRGRTDWVDVYHRLVAAHRVAEERALELERLDEEIRQWERQLDASAALDGHPVGALRANAELLLQTAERVRSIDARLQEIEGQAEERTFLHSESRLQAVRETIDLEAQLRECSMRLREQKAAVTIAAERLRDAETRVQNEWIDAEESGLADDGPNRPSPAIRFEQVRPLTAALASTALALGLIFGLSAPWWAGLLAGLAVMLGVRALNRALPKTPLASPVLPPAPDRRRSARPSVSTAPDPELPTATEGLTPEDARRQLAEAEAELERLRVEEREIEMRLESLRRDLGPYASTTPAELAKMEERWRLLDQQMEALRWEKLNLLEDRFGVSDDTWREVPVSETNEQLEALLLLPDAPGDGCEIGALIDWLADQTDADWSEFLGLERARHQLDAELARVRAQRDRLREDVQNDRSVQELTDRLEPFDLEIDPEELAARTATCVDLEARVRSLKEPLRDEDPALADSIGRAEAERDAAWERLVAVWPAERPTETSPGALAAWAHRHREAERPAREARQRHDWLEESAERLLRSVSVESRADLNAQIEEQQAALGAVLRDIESMESREGLFAALHGEGDPQARGRRVQQMQAVERAALAEERTREEDLEEQVRGMLKDQASLEGRDTPNLAALELRIQEMDDDLTRARRERDSLVLAFQWMEEAAEAFQGNHRENLESAVQSYFHALTGDSTRRVGLTERFELEVWDKTGHRLATEQLSQGARDQLLLSVRFAVADLLSSAVPLPFFFDDPFVHFDDRRLAATRQALKAIAPGRQWILLTHRSDLVEWAEPIFSQPMESFERTSA